MLCLLINIIFCLSALSVTIVQSRCKIVINEINIVDPKNPETHQFIELKSTCEENVALRGYKIIGFNCHGTSGKVELVINLWNERMKKGFYTIGGSEVSSADMKIPNDNIKFKNGFRQGKMFPSVSNFLINENKLSAIGLLYGERETFNDFKLSEKKQELSINDKLVGILKTNLVDLVIYGGKNACDKCSLFENS